MMTKSLVEFRGLQLQRRRTTERRASHVSHRDRDVWQVDPADSEGQHSEKLRVLALRTHEVCDRDRLVAGRERIRDRGSMDQQQWRLSPKNHDNQDTAAQHRRQGHIVTVRTKPPFMARRSVQVGEVPTKMANVFEGATAAGSPWKGNEIGIGLTLISGLTLVGLCGFDWRGEMSDELVRATVQLFESR